MIVLGRNLALFLLHIHLPVDFPLKVKHHIGFVFQVERNDGQTGHFFSLTGRDVKGQIIFDIADIGFPLSGKFSRNTFIRSL